MYYAELVINGLLVGSLYSMVALGFVLIYQPGYYLQNPGDILKIWQGGMAFHGGLIGVVVAAWLYILRHSLPLLSTADMIAHTVPPGLMLGRLANFINAELWGRPTDAPFDRPTRRSADRPNDQPTDHTDHTDRPSDRHPPIYPPIHRFPSFLARSLPRQYKLSQLLIQPEAIGCHHLR